MINNIEDAERVLKSNGYNLYHLGSKNENSILYFKGYVVSRTEMSPYDLVYGEWEVIDFANELIKNKK